MVNKIIVLSLFLLVLPLTTALTCDYNPAPYINEFRENKIWWQCYFDEIVERDCISYVRYHDRLIQTNPKEVKVDNFGIVNKFESSNGLMNVYFTSKDLRNNKEVTFGVDCGIEIFEVNVTPTYKKPDEYVDRGIWIFNNLGYVLFGLLILLVGIIVLGYLYRKII